MMILKNKGVVLQHGEKKNKIIQNVYTKFSQNFIKMYSYTKFSQTLFQKKILSYKAFSHKII